MRRLVFSLVLLPLFLALVVPLTALADDVEYDRGDVNRDGQVNVADVTALIKRILDDQWPEESDYEYVDLGLPSGTLWATCNVGANAPEEYGDYYAWGETSPKEVYDWSTYKWCNGSYNTLTKYCLQSSYGVVDHKYELDPEDDAAYVNWGPLWRMPSKEQLDELLETCSWIWMTINGVNGRMLTGPNGNTMFLPAADLASDYPIIAVNTSGFYWSRTLASGASNIAYFCAFGQIALYSAYIARINGYTVRAVRNL